MVSQGTMFPTVFPRSHREKPPTPTGAPSARLSIPSIFAALVASASSDEDMEMWDAGAEPQRSPDTPTNELQVDLAGSNAAGGIGSHAAAAGPALAGSAAAPPLASVPRSTTLPELSNARQVAQPASRRGSDPVNYAADAPTVRSTASMVSRAGADANHMRSVSRASTQDAPRNSSVATISSSSAAGGAPAQAPAPAAASQDAAAEVPTGSRLNPFRRAGGLDLGMPLSAQAPPPPPPAPPLIPSLVYIPRRGPPLGIARAAAVPEPQPFAPAAPEERTWTPADRASGPLFPPTSLNAVPASAAAAAVDALVAATAEPAPAATSAAAASEEEPPENRRTIRLTPVIDHTFGPSNNARIIVRHLHGPGRVQIGRQEDTTSRCRSIVLSSKVVSRVHAELLLTDDGWFIRDAGSSSGTFVNGQRLATNGTTEQCVPVRANDTIKLGMDFRGGTEAHYRAVTLRVSLGKPQKIEPTEFQKEQFERFRGGRNLDEPCAICLESMTATSATFVAPCFHAWHYRCVRQLIVRKYPFFECPMCRRTHDLEDEDGESNELDEDVSSDM